MRRAIDGKLTPAGGAHKLSQLDSLAAESTSSRHRTAPNAALNPRAFGVECRVASGHDEGTDGVSPSAMKTRSSSIGDEDKERMAMVPAIVPPDGKTSTVGAKDAVLRRSFAELVEVPQ